MIPDRGLAAILFLVGFAAGVVPLGCRKKVSPPQDTSAEEVKPALSQSQTPQTTQESSGVPVSESVIHRFKLVETRGDEKNEAEKVWELVAAVARRDGEHKFDLEDVTLKFFRANEVVGTLTGRTGTFDRLREEGHLAGGVTGESEEGYKIELESIEWQKKEDAITSEDPVKIAFDESVIRGNGLRASMNMKVFTTKNVRGEIRIDE